MSTLKDRLAIAMAGPPKVSKAALARACGVTPPSVNDWCSGKTKSLEGVNLIKAATRLQISPQWLATGKGEMRSNVTAIHPDDPLPDDVIQVPEYRVHFSAGNGHHVCYDLADEVEPATYRLSWFQKNRINPSQVRRFKVAGDSMEPFLFAGDSVLVNLAENDAARIVDGSVYAFRYGNELRVKRLFRRLDGTLTPRSENPRYKDEDVPPELAEEHITIIGRVRDKSGVGGL